MFYSSFYYIFTLNLFFLKNNYFVYKYKKKKMDKKNSLNKTNKENIYSFIDNIIEKLKNDDYNKNFDSDIYPNKNNLFKEDINDNRIKKSLILIKILNNYNLSFCPLNLDNLIQIELYNDINSSDYEFTNNENILMFWRSISKRVEKKNVLNFPMCILIQYLCKKIGNRENKIHYLSFLKHKDLNTLDQYKNESVKVNLFQKLIIFYTMDNIYGISSDNYIFNSIYTFSNTNKYTYKIKDLVFTLPIENIILLSPKTKLLNQRMKINDYINTLNNYEKDLIKLNKTYETFYELFLENFDEFFEKKIYNSKNIKQIMELSCETTNILPGNIYILSDSNLSMPVYIFILSINDTHIKYLVMFDSTIPKTLSLSIKIINKNTSTNKYYYPNLIFEKSFFNYTIGF